MDIKAIVKHLEAERNKIDAAIHALSGMNHTRTPRKRRVLSEAGRKRIAAAQRARWGKVKKAQKASS